MFIGHFGLAFGAKKAAPAVSLGALFAACQLADLLWPTLLLLGYERVEIQAGDHDASRRSTSSAIRTRTAWWRCACGALAFGAIYIRAPAGAHLRRRHASRCSSSATGCSTT